MRATRIKAAAGGLVAFALAGCIPVPTVVGRPAAVLPNDEVRLSFGAGAVDYDVTVSAGMPDSLSSKDETWGYGHYAMTMGLGRRIDMQAGMNNGQGFLDFRWQALGSPDGTATPRRFPIDLSFECGASTWIAVLAIPFAPYVPYGDAHYGINLSIPLGRVTPYASYRRHSVSYTFYDEDAPAHLSESGYPDISFKHEMYYCGIQFQLRGGFLRKGPRIAIEYFWGETTDPATGYYSLSSRVRGVNVVVSVIKW